MVEKLEREGWLRARRSRKRDMNKIPIDEWSEWHFGSCHGSGAFSYVYSSKGRAESEDRRTITEWRGQPTLPYPPQSRELPHDEWRVAYNKWQDSIPILGYIETEYRAIPAKITYDDGEE